MRARDAGGAVEGGWCKRRQAFIAELFIRLSVIGYMLLLDGKRITVKI